QLPTLAQVQSGQTQKSTYTYRLPFFAVEDTQLSDAQKLKLSPWYTVLRTDQFVAQQQLQNGTSQTQSFTWQVQEGFSETSIKTFSETTGIETSMSARHKAGNGLVETEVSFSIKLSQTFTYGIQHSETTSTTKTR